MPRLSAVYLIGSGDDDATPSVRCLLGSDGGCPQCKATHGIDTATLSNRTHRNQTMMILQFSFAGPDVAPVPSTTANHHTAAILVDCGLTFRDVALKAVQTRSLPFPAICGFICTRNSPHAQFGCDDIREVTQHGQVVAIVAPPTVLQSMARCFPYIMPTKTAQSANQKQLWTSHLKPAPPMAEGVVHQLLENYRPKRKSQDKPDGDLAAKNTTAATTTSTAAPHAAAGPETASANATTAAAAAATNTKEDDSSAEYIEPVSGSVEMLSLVVNADLCGFAISAESTGKLRDGGRVVVYIPGEITDTAAMENIAMQLQRFRVELAIVAFPKSTGATTWAQGKVHLAALNDRVLRAEAVVACCVPHFIPYVGSTGSTIVQEDGVAASSVEMGFDGMLAFAAKAEDAAEGSKL